ncbi:phosphotransferase enzyme family domain protein [Mycobacterium xenopi 4042]|uniref:Phosphotransferase enzyme family domain protein n=1 Tax=Mycobacterium xenopi 4042 TaxID=1299334 RepID=X8BGV2_MYCXE|nr:phosphotransferase enzyme family domain protein [Mycobacterium xenopi 4042]
MLPHRTGLQRRNPVGPPSVVLKVAATDPVSRQTGLTLGLYEREVRFYREIAPRVHGPLAPCYHTAFDAAAGAFDVLLGDASPAVVGDEIRGATTSQAMVAVAELGRLQGQLFSDIGLADAAWLNRDAPINQALMTQLYAGSSTVTVTGFHRSTTKCANGWSMDSTPTSPAIRVSGALTGCCTATTGWTTCCSAPPGRSAADGGGLADRHLGSGIDRPGVFRWLRTAGG